MIRLSAGRVKGADSSICIILELTTSRKEHQFAAKQKPLFTLQTGNLLNLAAKGFFQCSFKPKVQDVYRALRPNASGKPLSQHRALSVLCVLQESAMVQNQGPHPQQCTAGGGLASLCPKESSLGCLFSSKHRNHYSAPLLPVKTNLAAREGWFMQDLGFRKSTRKAGAREAGPGHIRCLSLAFQFG